MYTNIHIYTYTYKYIYIHIYVYMHDSYASYSSLSQCGVYCIYVFMSVEYKYTCTINKLYI